MTYKPLSLEVVSSAAIDNRYTCPSLSVSEKVLQMPHNRSTKVKTTAESLTGSLRTLADVTTTSKPVSGVRPLTSKMQCLTSEQHSHFGLRVQQLLHCLSLPLFLPPSLLLPPPPSLAHWENSN